MKKTSWGLPSLVLAIAALLGLAIGTARAAPVAHDMPAIVTADNPIVTIEHDTTFATPEVVATNNDSGLESAIAFTGTQFGAMNSKFVVATHIPATNSTMAMPEVVAHSKESGPTNTTS